MYTDTDKSLNNIYKGLFFAIFFSTGFSALIFQVIWQRVLAIHAGVDLYSVTTIVAAFMAGLGLGSLLGGYIADRLSTRGCFVSFSVSNFMIGAFGFISLWLFYDVYNSLIPYLGSTSSSFAFHFVLLCIPTTFMGVSLPLLSKALVRTSDELSSLVGTLYGINTLGAAVGAFLGAWFMLGTLGFVKCTQIASSINVICGLLVILFHFKLIDAAPTSHKISESMTSPLLHATASEKEWILLDKPTAWILIYGITGFAALSLEIVWFRLLNVFNGSIYMQSSYSFGNFLFVYLCGLGLGSLVSSRIIKRIRRPDLMFFWMQFLIGMVSLLLIVFFPRSEIVQYISGLEFSKFRRFQGFVRLFMFLNIPAVFIIGLPTFFMGICFPLIQRIVSRHINTLGSSLSKLLFSNILGNILGSLVTGFFLLDYFGTPGTLKIICGMLLVTGIIAGYCVQNHALRSVSIASVTLIGILLVGVVFPNDKEFWSYYQDLEAAEDFVFLEDRTSLQGLAKFRTDDKEHPYRYEVLTDGQRPSSIPYGGIHSLLGIAPTLYHPDPKSGLVIGFASGDTLYSMARDNNLEKLICVELSGGQYEVIQTESVRDPLLWQAKTIFHDPRIELIAGDGRKFLLNSKEKFDLIEIDAIIPSNAYSGNLYSVEFFQLIKQHLNPGGILTQWIPTARVEKSVMKAFPYVMRFDKIFVLASNEPLSFSKSEIIRRLKTLNLSDHYIQAEEKYLNDFFTNTFPDNIQVGSNIVSADDDTNSDLFPKDEYFMNNKLTRPMSAVIE